LERCSLKKGKKKAPRAGNPGACKIQ